MKKFLMLFMAVVLCFALTVPVFAAEYDFPMFDIEDGQQLYIIDNTWDEPLLYYAVVGNDDSRVVADGSSVTFFGVTIYETREGEGWTLFPTDGFNMYLDEVVYNTHDIIDKQGSIVKKGMLFSDSTTEQPTLSSLVSVGSLSGVLGEVCSLLIWVIPAVLVLFGIRKGIVFLFARIRGV